MRYITERGEVAGDPRYFITGYHHIRNAPHVAAVFAPKGIAETLNTLQTAHSYRPNSVSVVAVTEAPIGLQERAIATSANPYLHTIVIDDYLAGTDVPKSVIGGGLVAATIFVERDHMRGDTVADAFRELNPQKMSVLSNNHAGLERLVAETSHELFPTYDFRVTPLWANEILSSKYKLTQMQESLLGFKMPLTARAKTTDDSGEKKEARELKEEILKHVLKVGTQTDGDVIMKPDSAFGSEEVYRISRDLPIVEKEKIVTKYLRAFRD